MSELHYTDLSVKGYRGLSELSIPSLGRVNLVTGKNNAGKSSLLEALRLHAENAAYHTITNILVFREELLRNMEDNERLYDMHRTFQISTLFHGFPQIGDDFGPIEISAHGHSRFMYLKMSVDWFIEERDAEGRQRLSDKQSTLFGEADAVPALVVSTEYSRRVRPLDSLLRYNQLRGVPRARLSDEPRMPCILVSPYGMPTNIYGGERLPSLGELWDGINLTDDEKEVVKALCIIDSRISAVGMIGDGPRRTAMVRAEHISRPLPLRSFGDGLNRLFAIILSLVNARGGILLIDEFENGLHHAVQIDVWRTIFRLAVSLDVQVFVTTHSKDAVEAFQIASAENPEEGILVRLASTGDRVVPTVATEQELAIATHYDIEVR